MSELVEFLRARFAEDVRAAEAARMQVAERACPPVQANDWVERAGRWKAVPWLFTGRAEANLEQWGRVEISTLANDHIARHDPGRVLTEVEAKRQVVKLHQRLPMGEFCAACDAPLGVPGVPYGCATLRILALPYADHPDYREEWKP